MQSRFAEMEAVGEPRSAGRMGTIPPPRDDRTIGSLIKELRDETTTLLRQEVALAKTEVSEKAAAAGRNVAYLAAGAAVAYSGLLFLLLGATLLLTWAFIAADMNRYVAYWLAPLIVGTVVGVVGYSLIQKALNLFSHPERLAPNQTLDSMQENAQWAKNKVTG